LAKERCDGNPRQAWLSQTTALTSWFFCDKRKLGVMRAMNFLTNTLSESLPAMLLAAHAFYIARPVSGCASY